MATQRYATYKGRTYRLGYLGTTKFGRKAKLAFLDGSKEFWVDASLVSECQAPSGQPASAGRTQSRSRSTYSRYPRTGCSCGSRDGIIQDSDCAQCVHDA